MYQKNGPAGALRVPAGYDEQKRQIEDTVLLALLHPEVYEEVAKGTRRFAADSPRPRAVLFEGPPGCGKTTSARCARGWQPSFACWLLCGMATAMIHAAGFLGCTSCQDAF